jgi:hypothetical protein
MPLKERGTDKAPKMTWIRVSQTATRMPCSGIILAWSYPPQFLMENGSWGSGIAERKERKNDKNCKDAYIFRHLLKSYREDGLNGEPDHPSRLNNPSVWHGI